MSPPRYRTLDGDEIPFPLAMDRWVLVPRGLARFDPELAWALDYEDAPEPDDSDPRLDFALGALLVPVERWNEHAELEPNLAPCYSLMAEPLEVPATPRLGGAPLGSVGLGHGEEPRLAVMLARTGARVSTLALAALALAYVVGVAAWLWRLHDGITGPKVSTGVMLLGVAVLLAWLAGIAGSGGSFPSRRARRGTRPLVGAAALIGHPLDILRLGLVAQLAGFVLLVMIH